MVSKEYITVALQLRWQEFAQRCQLPQPEAIWDAIATLYSEEERAYHNLHYIHDCLEKWDAWPNKPEQEAAQYIELALWFHDIIYDSRRADNEEASAALLSHFIKDHPLCTETMALILSTRHRDTEGMRCEEILCDIDLSILGAPTEQYQRYARAIRQEYAWVPIENFAPKRSKILENFLNRESIFHTDHAKKLWQTQVPSNLAWEINELKQAVDHELNS
ncbi:HD domain-containing protein [Rubritalea marina]|uniref:HD domain-containing protein n=1 Tax=Rubritalea marina TaxID=361055 RepID=UPI000368091B|nr:hypothetical protein [Rubritalea marina]